MEIPLVSSMGKGLKVLLIIFSSLVFVALTLLGVFYSWAIFFYALLGIAGMGGIMLLLYVFFGRKQKKPVETPFVAVDREEVELYVEKAQRVVKRRYSDHLMSVQNYTKNVGQPGQTRDRILVISGVGYYDPGKTFYFLVNLDAPQLFNITDQQLTPLVLEEHIQALARNPPILKSTEYIPTTDEYGRSTVKRREVSQTPYEKEEEAKIEEQVGEEDTG